MTCLLSSSATMLLQAADAVPGKDLTASLGELARALPVPTSSEVVAIRLRATDGDRLFHVVALEGASPRERRSRALNPIALPAVKSIVALGAQHSLSQALGFRWLESGWITAGNGPAGVVFLAARTERRMTEGGRRLLDDVCERLGTRLEKADRSEKALLDASRRLARESAFIPDTPADELEPLRPRERMIVTLYAEGLAVDDIAQVLVISPHTVRTHVKNAFRRLGVHSRDEAARLVFADEVRRLL